MLRLSEQFQLSSRNTMVHETPYYPPVLPRTEEEDDDRLSEGENNDSAEMIRECPSSSCSGLVCGVSGTRLGQHLPFNR